MCISAGHSFKFLLKLLYIVMQEADCFAEIRKYVEVSSWSWARGVYITIGHCIFDPRFLTMRLRTSLKIGHED